MGGAEVKLVEASRCFRLGAEEVWALRDVSIEAAPGEFLALIGRSGSGKTTLLNLIGGLDKPTSGDVLIDGRSVPGMSEKELTNLRRHTLGFIFQSFGLLPLLSAYENVELPLRIAGAGHRERARRTRQVLDLVGLTRRAEHRPYELSGGEQQRVAIARALATRPRLILADEPTGELDSATAAAIFALMRDLSHAEGVTLITSTHDRLVMELADRVEELANGRHAPDVALLRAVTERERSPFAAQPSIPKIVETTTHDSVTPEAGTVPPVTGKAAPSAHPPATVIAPEPAAAGNGDPRAASPAAAARTLTPAAGEPDASVTSDLARSPESVPVSGGARSEQDSPPPDDDIMRWAPPGRR